MKRILIFLLIATILLCGILSIDTGIKSPTPAQAARSYTVQSGDSLWKIAVRFQVGLSEIINANRHIKNPDLIYPGQVISIPDAPPFKAMEDEVIRLVNQERQKRGLHALSYDWQVARVARIKSQDMIENRYFRTHRQYTVRRSICSKLNIRYTVAAENIAYGQRSALGSGQCVDELPGHRQNILNPSVTKIGVGIARTYNGVYYFTQIFIR